MLIYKKINYVCKIMYIYPYPLVLASNSSPKLASSLKNTPSVSD